MPANVARSHSASGGPGSSRSILCAVYHGPSFRYIVPVVLVLGDPPGPDAAPKLAVLSRLRRAGLPVPPGLGVCPDELADPQVRARLTALLADGPVIVRAALLREDQADASAAGLGLSIADCHDLAAIDRAAAEIAAASRDSRLIHYSGGLVPAHQLLIQRQIPRRWLAVLAADRTSALTLELHDATHPDALARGATPIYAGPLALADPPLAHSLTKIFNDVLSNMSEATSLDLEIVINFNDVAWLVQARPLARPLTPGWSEFCAALAPGCDQIPDLPGLWQLDAEHNPAALSPAHAGVITWLIGQGSSHLRILNGWLYEPASTPPSTSPSFLKGPREVLVDLRCRHLPAARRQLAAFDRDLPGDLLACLPRALEHLRAVLAIYTDLRVPLPRDLPAPGPGVPLSLRERDAYLDVLPATWDIASPTLADLSVPPSSEVAIFLNDEEEGDLADCERAAVLVRELDDHLFALGLAPLRRLYLAAGARLGLGDDVFLLTPDELHRALAHGSLPDLDHRRRQHARHAELRPPLALFDGRPVPLSPRRRLCGLPFGPGVTGSVAQRRDLTDLLARPPEPGAIVVLPALTAQAAVALRMLGVRAVCCEHGGALSHAALMVRELGLSALIGCAGCSELPDGLRVELDARLGRLRPC